MVQYAQQHGIKLACFGTVAGGWLSDKWLGTSAPPSRAALGRATVSARMYNGSLQAWSGGDWGLFQDLLLALRAVADKHGTTVANVAVAWVLRQLGPGGGWAILGVRDAGHLEEHAALRSVSLDAADSAQVEAVLARGRAPVGDIWDRERS